MQTITLALPTQAPSAAFLFFSWFCVKERSLRRLLSRKREHHRHKANPNLLFHLKDNKKKKRGYDGYAGYAMVEQSWGLGAEKMSQHISSWVKPNPYPRTPRTLTSFFYCL
jgi:hypothetical protein